MFDTLRVFLLFLLLNLTCVEAQTINLRRQVHNMLEFKQLHEYSSSSNSSLADIGLYCFLVSPILFVFSFIIIWNNQRKAAIDQRRMKLAQSLVNEVNPFQQNEIKMKSSYGKLLYVTGNSQCNEILNDAESGINFNGVLKIFKQVQVREFRLVGTENENNIRYELQWVTQNLPSPGEGYNNDPGCWFIKSKTMFAKRVNIGKYLLNEKQIFSLIQLAHQEIYKPKRQDAYNIAIRSNGRVKNQPIVDLQNGGYIYFPTIAGTFDGPGTLRVRYKYCTHGQTSIIAQYSQNTFVPFRIDIQQNGVADMQQDTNDCYCCYHSRDFFGSVDPITQIDLITQRKSSYHEMIDQQLKSLRCKTCKLRLYSYLLMVMSLCAFFIPITTLIGFVPFLGNYLSNIIGLAICLAAVIVCIPLFLLTLSISWLVFHPKVGLILIGIGLLITGIVLAVIFTNEGNNNSNDAQKTAEAIKHLAYTLKSLF